MKPIKQLSSALLLSSLLFAGCSSHKAESDIDKRVKEIVSNMSIEEKVGQMTQVTLDVIAKGGDRYSSEEPLAVDLDSARKAIVKYHVGSFLNTTNNRARTPEVWYNTIKVLQDIATKETNCKVPIIYGIDAIHGTTYTAGATLFPHQIALAATFNPAHARALGTITAYETRASNQPWNFSPVLDLAIDPRFPRQFESFGEDPYLGSVMGVELVKGYEGDNNDISNPYKVASCIKHFLGYQVPISGQDRTPAYIPEHVLREYHLPAFKAAVEAGAKTIMINSGVINGEPVHANAYILTKILRKELGFKGVVVTDWADIENLHFRDKIASTYKEAIKKAINAGIDMSMVPYKYEPFCDNLVALVKEGEVKESTIDAAVSRIIKLKLELGLFEKPIVDYRDYPQFGSKAHEEASYDAAAEAITLLKNENNLLPLKKGTKIAVVGPNANTMRSLNGGWSYSWQGEKSDEFADKYNTILEAMQVEFGANNVFYTAGVEYDKAIEYYKENKKDFDKVVSTARKADVVMLCVGENSYTEGPGNLTPDLYLSELQTELVKEVAKAGKPIILVLNEGRPRVISKIESLTKAVIQTYLPSNHGGDALAHIVSGKVNPSGKLPYTYPKSVNAFGPYYFKPSENVTTMEGVYNYEANFAAQYPFGFGLSYTTFTYSKLNVSKNALSQGDNITVEVTVKNSGSFAGKEVVMLFSSDEYASMTPDVKRLRRFQKIDLNPGEEKQVTFTLSTKDLAFVNHTNDWVTEPGDFILQISNLTQRITVK